VLIFEDQSCRPVVVSVPNLVFVIGAFLLGASAGAVLVRLRTHGQKEELRRLNEERARREGELETLRAEVQRRVEDNARLDERSRLVERALEEQRAFVAQTEQKLTEAFRQLSAGVVGEQTQKFLGLAEHTFRRELEQREERFGHLVRPLQETLGRFDQKIEALEKTRTQEEATLREQIRSLAEIHIPRIARQTEDLTRALSQPGVRGRWGELQLRRVVELAGLQEHVDFELQASHVQDGQTLRPDAVVHLPGGRSLVVDAKTPIDEYHKALQASAEETKGHLLRYARQVRGHIEALTRRSYPDLVADSPDFTVLFFPGEPMFRAAAEADPGLVEYGIEKGVIVTTPLTLVALLKAVAYGWQQEKAARNLSAVVGQARELRGRLAKFLDHWSKVGERLDQAVRSYNDAVGSYQRRVLVTLRRFEEFGGGDEESLEPPAVLAERPILPTPQEADAGE
jgi:DNA recombination protein RmuC